MNEFLRFAIPIWRSSDGREPSPARGPRRSGGGADSSRPVPNATWLLIIGIALALVLIFGLQFAGSGAAPVEYSFFRSQLESGDRGNVKSIIFRDERIIGEWKDPPLDPKRDEKQPEKNQPDAKSFLQLPN